VFWIKPVSRVARGPASIGAVSAYASRMKVRTQEPVRPATQPRRVPLVAVVVLTAPVWLAVLLAIALVRLVHVMVLYAMVWLWWIGRARRRVLFVYSDSPNWKEYVEANILPKLPKNTVILNWSNRAQWPRFSFPVALFRCFAGSQEFNPIGLVFDRFDLVERYRFWQPFRDAKHGRVEALQFVETRFLEHAATDRGR